MPLDVDLSQKKYLKRYGGKVVTLNFSHSHHLEEIDKICEKVKERINTENFELGLGEDVFVSSNVQEELSIRIENIITEMKIGLKGYDRKMLIKEVSDRITSFGPISDLIRDESLDDLVINNPKEVLVKKNGQNVWEKLNIRFRNDKEVLRIGNNLLFAGGSGRQASIRLPDVTGPGPYKTRVNVTTWPLSEHTTITIRRQKDNYFTLEELVRSKMLTLEMADFIRKCTLAKVDQIIFGPTGSGKTTFGRALIDIIPKEERIVTIEKQREWHIYRENVIQLQARYTGEPDTTITEYQLCEESLYRRPDRILIGEIVGREADIFLFALNNGHQGSFTTAHAKSIEHGLLNRIPYMISKSGMQIDREEVRTEICSTLELAYFCKFIAGRRIITEISEILGYSSGKVNLNPLYIYKINSVSLLESGERKVDGEFVKVGTPKGPVKDKLFEAGFLI